MLNALFVIGAGVNRCINSERLGTPPLARDLFSSSLLSVQRMDRYMGSQYRLPELERSYALSARRVWGAVRFISDEFRISRDDLFKQPFNIEDLFTRLELREREARDGGDQALEDSIAAHQQTVVSLLATQLAVFRSAALPVGATVMADPDVLAIPMTYRTTVLRPLVVAPLENKDFSQWPFPIIWSEAERIINGASTLAIVGYSFPPTDRAARKLLSGAASSGQLKRLIVVNPDVTVVKEAQKICGFEGSVDHFPSVETFLAGSVDV